MSYCTDPNGYHEHGCPGYAAERQAAALERIADTLDDYMDLTLAGQRLTSLARTPNPDMSTLDEMFQAIDASLAAVAARRAARKGVDT